MSTGNRSQGNGHTVTPTPGQQPTTNSSLGTSTYSPSPIRYFNPVPPPYLPGGARSLPAISIRAFCLGLVAGICSCLTVLLIYVDFATETPSSSMAIGTATASIGYLWRIPFFITTLAIFHYLEFDTTARYNTVDAKVASFLLFNNGWAYNVAHCAAMFECWVTWLIRSRYADRIPSLSSILSLLGVDATRVETFAVFPTIPASVTIALGLIMIVVGQVTRNLAMKTAGTSFNHIVQATKKVDHVLVTHGVYGISRHPSYFGFFWWGLGTQVVLGNRICFLAYGAVLWTFFSHRIAMEEKHLIKFFGEAYVAYRSKTPVLIPFI